jgi:hypothetical protein
MLSVHHTHRVVDRAVLPAGVITHGEPSPATLSAKGVPKPEPMESINYYLQKAQCPINILIKNFL